MDWQAIGLSLRLSACTTLILIALGVPLAWWLANTRWRWRFFIEAVVALPIVLPPTVIGFYVLVGIGSHSPLGRFYESLFGQRLPFSFEGLLLASVLYSLPFAVQPFVAPPVQSRSLTAQRPRSERPRSPPMASRTQRQV